MKFEKFPGEPEDNPYKPPESEESSKEQEGDFELREQMQELDEKAQVVGEQLENVDVDKLDKEGFNKVTDAIDRVMGGVYILAGSAAGGFAWAAMEEDPMGAIQKTVAAAVIVLGVSVGVKGFDQLIRGSKSFFEELTPEQKAELKS